MRGGEERHGLSRPYPRRRWRAGGGRGHSGGVGGGDTHSALLEEDKRSFSPKPLGVSNFFTNRPFSI